MRVTKKLGPCLSLEISGQEIEIVEISIHTQEGVSKEANVENELKRRKVNGRKCLQQIQRKSIKTARHEA